MSKTIEVVITADTRRLRKGLITAELRITRSRWRRLRLRFDLWRVNRELSR